MSTAAAEVLRQRIEQRGPRPFDEVMEIALYDPENGFFAITGAAGRRGDFMTSPEVGPLFGAVLARALDSWWDELGRPDPFLVVEAGAGVGTLARAVLAASPECACALTYVLVERSASLRAAHEHGLPLVAQERAELVSGAVDAVSVIPTCPSPGPRVVSTAELPAPPLTGVILANELLDNLGFRIVERRHSGWNEVRVGWDGQGFVEMLVPGGSDLIALAEAVGIGVADGCRIPLQTAAVDWVGDALARLDAGRLVVFDYAATTATLAKRGDGWLRTFRAHGRGTSPLADLGQQDITSDVALDQITRRHPPSSVRTQAEFLRSFGIDGLVEEGRATWRERAAIGDLEAVRGRSRVREAEALLDESGLGAFLVLEWGVGAEM